MGDASEAVTFLRETVGRSADATFGITAPLGDGEVVGPEHFDDIVYGTASPWIESEYIPLCPMVILQFDTGKGRTPPWHLVEEMRLESETGTAMLVDMLSHGVDETARLRTVTMVFDDAWDGMRVGNIIE